jgi:hypothetical protein
MGNAVRQPGKRLLPSLANDVRQPLEVPEDSFRALTSIKGVRDITSGIVPLVVLAVAGHHAFGWALLAAAITPIGDAIIVTRNGGTLRHALSVHGATALVLIVAGLVIVLA